MSTHPIIAVTHLNTFSTIKVLLLNPSFRIVYYKKHIPDFLFNLLRKRNRITECNFNIFPNFFEEAEKRLYAVASQLVRTKPISGVIDSVYRYLRIEKRHVVTAFTMHLFKLIRDDVYLLVLSEKIGCHNNSIEFWTPNWYILNLYYKKKFRMDFRFNKQDILIRTYLIVWIVWLVAIFCRNLRKKEEVKQFSIVFQQKYAKRFGWNPEFEAFYRYFRDRDDVAYHCIRKNDEIYQCVVEDGKYAFTTADLKLTLSDIFAYIKTLGCLLSVLFTCRLHQKSDFLYILLHLYREFVTINCILKQFSPRLFIRIRPEMYENHPIITGVCEKRQCIHVGYQHSPPVYFDANYAIADFHYLGVLGRNSLDDIYSRYIKDIDWSVLGPITAEIGYESMVPEKETGTIFFFATSAVNDPQDTLFKAALQQTVRFLKNRGIKMIYRDKGHHPSRMKYMDALCRSNNIQYERQFSNAEKDINGLASFAIRRADLVVVCSHSTAAWECLALGKKFIVYPDTWNRHPLEDFEPRLAVRDGDDFQRTIVWLWDLPQSTYLQCTEEIVNAISKPANGKMVKEFFENFIGIDRLTADLRDEAE